MVTKKPNYKQNISDSFVPIFVKDLSPTTADEGDSTTELHNASDLIKNVRRLLIRGPAGCGKTTLLQWLIWKCDPFGTETKASNSLPYFPIYIPLRKLEQFTKKKLNLNDVLQKTLPEDFLKQHMPLNWLDSLVERKIEVLILIDGLDEVPEVKRPAIWNLVHQISTKYKTLRVLLTSRSYSRIWCLSI
jgi:predicted NACHT family NTPase